MEQIVYEDKTQTDIWIRLIISLPSVTMFASALLVLEAAPQEGIYMLAASILLWLLLYFMVIPCKYVIYKGRIVIGFRGPFSFNIPFSTVKGLRRDVTLSMGINLPTRISSANAIQIVRKKQMNIMITPSDINAFLKGFDKAYSEWQKYGGK